MLPSTISLKHALLEISTMTGELKLKKYGTYPNGLNDTLYFVSLHESSS